MADSWLKIQDRAFRTLLFNKFNSVLKYQDEGEEKKSVLLMPQPTALREITERRGSSEMEFINYWRDEYIFDWDRGNTSAARTGLFVEGDVNSQGQALSGGMIKAVPLKLRYNIWYWTVWPDKLNEFTEAFIWWQHTNPNFNILLNDAYPLEIDLHFTSMKDESTVDMQFTTGRYFVVSGSITLDTWLFKVPDPFSGSIEKIVLQIFDKDDLSSDEDYISVIVPEDPTYNEELHDILLLVHENITG